MRINSKRFVAVFMVIAATPVVILFYLLNSIAEEQVLPGSHGCQDEVCEQIVARLERENIRLTAELQKSHEQSASPNCSALSNGSQCEVIHVCIVCAGYDAARDVTTVIKSLLFYRTNTLHFHFIVDTISLPILNTLFQTWAIPSALYSFYSTSPILDDVSWVPNSHYSGVFGLMKLQLPYVLPPSVDRVILLDTDVVFSANIVELWRYFSVFQPSQLLALVENLSDWYLPHPKITRWPAQGRGYNTGVMLMKLDRMRENEWGRLWRQTVNKYSPTYGHTSLADQDVINAIIKDTNGMIVHPLPCAWNVQLTLKSTFEASCYSATAAKVLHFNSQYKHKVYFGSHRKDLMADYFKNVYFMFVQYDGNLLKHKSLTSGCGEFETNITSTRSVIGELMESSEEVSAACYQVEGLRRSSRGRLHLYYIAYNYTVQPGDVTLVAQLSIDRLGVLEQLCEHWTGPMSVALYLSDSQAQQFHDFVRNSHIISSRQNIGYHVVFKTGTHYPVNYLRNVALNHAPTEYVFLTDIDFVPMMNMYEYLRDSANLHIKQNNKIALVVPAFETQQYKPEMPSNKDELKKFVHNGQVQIFRNDIWPAGHAPTNYSRWYNSSQPYVVSWKPNYEPYIVVNREIVPKYDERFFGFGWNKVSHIMEVDAQGFKMMVLPHAFIIHSPHAPSLDISQYRSSAIYRQCLKTLKKEFQKDLSRSYGIRALKYLSND